MRNTIHMAGTDKVHTGIDSCTFSYRSNISCLAFPGSLQEASESWKFAFVVELHKLRGDGQSKCKSYCQCCPPFVLVSEVITKQRCCGKTHEGWPAFRDLISQGLSNRAGPSAELPQLDQSCIIRRQDFQFVPVRGESREASAAN